MARSVVLVHGAWHGSWCWERVMPLLRDAGVDATAVDLPSRAKADGTLHDDGARVRSVLDASGGGVVLVRLPPHAPADGDTQPSAARGGMAGTAVHLRGVHRRQHRPPRPPARHGAPVLVIPRMADRPLTLPLDPEARGRPADRVGPVD